jgi:hypothetical protein
MSATNAFETSLLGLIFTNVDAANVGDATGLRGSTTAGVFWISLHTGAGPGETGNQTTNEAAYTSYARQDEARNTSQWTVTNNTADNDNAITFPQATGGSETEAHFGIGSATSGTGNLFLYGALTAGLAVSNGITPEFAAGALDVTLD